MTVAEVTNAFTSKDRRPGEKEGQSIIVGLQALITREQHKTARHSDQPAVVPLART